MAGLASCHQLVDGTACVCVCVCSCLSHDSGLWQALGPDISSCIALFVFVFVFVLVLVLVLVLVFAFVFVFVFVFVVMMACGRPFASRRQAFMAWKESAAVPAEIRDEWQRIEKLGPGTGKRALQNKLITSVVPSSVSFSKRQAVCMNPGGFAKYKSESCTRFKEEKRVGISWIEMVAKLGSKEMLAEGCFACYAIFESGPVAGFCRFELNTSLQLYLYVAC